MAKRNEKMSRAMAMCRAFVASPATNWYQWEGRGDAPAPQRATYDALVRRGEIVVRDGVYVVA
jgi:hypothetical protein